MLSPRPLPVNWAAAASSRIATVLAGYSLQSKTNGSYRQCGKAANVEVDRQVWAETVRRLEGLLAAAPTSPFLRSCDELRSICFRIREPLIASSHAPGSRIEAGRTVDRWLRKFSVVRGIACNASKLRQPCCR